MIVKDIHDESISGERQSDKKIISVPFEAISLKEFADNNDTQERTKLNGFKADPLEKVAIAHWSYGKTYVTGKHFMLAYLVGYTLNSCKIRLLGGDLVTINRPNYRLYEPNDKELNEFKKVENDQYFIDKEYKRTISLTKEHMSSPSIENNFTINKFTRYLSVRGCTNENIIKAINYLRENYTTSNVVGNAFLKQDAASSNTETT